MLAQTIRRRSLLTGGSTFVSRIGPVGRGGLAALAGVFTAAAVGTAGIDGPVPASGRLLTARSADRS